MKKFSEGYHSPKDFTCPECGEKLTTEDGLRFCKYCGAKVEDIVDEINCGQDEDGPCGDSADDENSPYYQGEYSTPEEDYLDAYDDWMDRGGDDYDESTKKSRASFFESIYREAVPAGFAVMVDGKIWDNGLSEGKAEKLMDWLLGKSKFKDVHVVTPKEQDRKGIPNWTMDEKRAVGL